MNEWRRITAILEPHAGSPDDCFTDVNDGVFEVARAPAAQMPPGLDGVTWSRCHANQILEADVWVTDSYAWDEPESTQLVMGGGIPVLMHEFGHVMGMAHSNGFTLMIPGWPKPLQGGTGAHTPVAPDEAAGVRFEYAQFPWATFAYRDLSASAQEFSGGALRSAFPGDIAVSRGATFSMDWTIANPGDTSLTFNTRFFISTNPLATSGSWTWFWNGGTVNSGQAFTWTAQFTIPASIAPGTYFMFVEPNYDRAVSETNLSNNIVRQAGRIFVN